MWERKAVTGRRRERDEKRQTVNCFHIQNKKHGEGKIREKILSNRK